MKPSRTPLLLAALFPALLPALTVEATGRDLDSRLRDLAQPIGLELSEADRHYAAIATCLQLRPEAYDEAVARYARAGYEHEEWGGLHQLHSYGLTVTLSPAVGFCDVASSYFGMQATEALVDELFAELNGAFPQETRGWTVTARDGGCFRAELPGAEIVVNSGGQDPVCPQTAGGRPHYPPGDLRPAPEDGPHSAFRIMWE